MQEVLIGEYMKNHREAHGMTQSELCAGICDPSTPVSYTHLTLPTIVGV